jgi:hypothetical protein
MGGRSQPRPALLRIQGHRGSFAPGPGPAVHGADRWAARGRAVGAHPFTRMFTIVRFPRYNVKHGAS